ncbi:MAG: succinate dehydrogenase/fumarate reductase iron-sulfur subunit [Halobacteriaceae archaeon]
MSTDAPDTTEAAAAGEQATEAGEAADASAGPDHQARRMAEKASRRAAREEAAAAGESEPAGETVRLKVFRYDPEVEAKAETRFDTFHVPVEQGMTVLDALIHARDEYDPTLTFRHSCRQAVCGSDAFLVNGRQRLGCQTQIADLDWPVRVEPLPHQDVVKDLVVDMEHFYDQMAAVEPYFQTDDLPPVEDLEEQHQTRENREKIKMSTRCIWCGACMSSCNIAAGDNEYLGPAAINKAYRFYMDDREGETQRERRMEVIAENHGVWRCQTQFSCTEVCPKDIPLTEHIQELKREAVKSNLKFW